MNRRSGFGRVPSCEMTARSVIELLDALEQGGVTVWLDGGWAVDASLGTQTRPHDDLDLVVALHDIVKLRAILGAHGYALEAGEAPLSLELVDAGGRQVDVHPVRFAENGDGLYRMSSGEDWVYPAVGFTGRGVVIDTPVRCLTPEVQMLCHTGYEPHRRSYDDVWALSRHFDLPVPEEYSRPRETYRLRDPATS